MTILIIFLTLVTACRSLYDLFHSRPSALWIGWCAMVWLRFSDANVPTWAAIAYWGIAAAIVTAIGYMLPRKVSESRLGMGYFGVGAIVGASVGFMALPYGSAGLIVGSVAGLLIAAAAFARTPQGKPVAASLRRYANYVLAKGSYAVVVVVMLAIAIINMTLLIKTLL